jgi:pimeloyl-ACP methyl ester carboxylesterase
MSTVLIAALLFATADPCLTVHEIRAPSAGHYIAAEIATRQPNRRLPTVILISGAGPHTRDYSTDTGDHVNGNGAFRVLRDSLTMRGYAVVRFDERGTGRSSGDYAASATTASLAEDVEGLLAALESLPEVDPRKFVLLGHSEGAAIAWLVASRRKEVAAVIAMAGPAWTGQRIMDWQHTQLVRRDVWNDADSTQEARWAILQQTHATRKAADPWYRYFLSFDPTAAVAHLTVPMLLVHGEKDWQVSPQQATEVAAVARRHGNARVKLAFLKDYDHGFRYRGGMDPLPGRVVSTVQQWLQTELPTRTPQRTCRVSDDPT